MQIKYLPKNIYKLYSYARTQECLDVYRKKYQTSVDTWSKLKKEGVCDKTCSEITTISRATYFRRKQILKNLEFLVVQDMYHTTETAQMADLILPAAGSHLCYQQMLR